MGHRGQAYAENDLFLYLYGALFVPHTGILLRHVEQTLLSPVTIEDIEAQGG